MCDRSLPIREERLVFARFFPEEFVDEGLVLFEVVTALWLVCWRWKGISDEEEDEGDEEGGD